MKKSNIEEERKKVLEELKAANQQLDASNPQLRASEQQLKAANQQLDAANQQLVASEQKLKAANQQLEASNQQLIASEDEIKKHAHELGERVKELQCMYGVTESIRTRDTLEETFRDVAELIPPGWHYPEITRGKVLFDEKVYVSEPFEETKWKQSCDIIVNGEPQGSVEVYYLEECPELDEGPFMKEERNLIDGIARNISEAIEHKRAEEALHKSEEKFRVLYNNSPDMYASVSPNDASILLCNETLLKKTGYSREEIIGSSIFNMYHDDYMDEVKKTFQQFVETGIIKDKELILKRKDGSPMDVSLNVNAVKDDAGNILHSISSLRDITVRKQAEEALKKSKETAERYLEVAAELIITLDSRGRITLLNESGHGLLGYRIGELIGRNWFDTCLPEHIRKEVREVFKKLMRGEIENIETYENPVLTKNGEERMILWHNTLLRDKEGNIVGTLSSGEDITESRRAEGALRESEQRFRILFEDSIDGIYITNTDGTIIDCNPALLELFGYTKEEMIIIDVSEIYVNPQGREIFKKNISENGFVKNFEVKMHRKDTTEIDCSINAVARRDNNGNIIGYQGIIRDITGRKRIEETRKELEEMKSKFILMASHEIGTPVMAMEHRIDSLEDGLETLNPEEKADIDSMRYNLERLKNLKTSMSNLAILELGKFRLKKEAVFMQSITKHVVEELNFLAKEKDIEINIDMQNLPVITADKERIHEVVTALVDNAVRYTPEGGSVQVTGKEDEDFIEVMVKDNGIGISKDEQEKIFDRFYQVKSIMLHKEGFGLGLSLAKEFIESHGGDIRVESEPGKGSSFYFRIPKE